MNIDGAQRKFATMHALQAQSAAHGCFQWQLSAICAQAVLVVHAWQAARRREGEHQNEHSWTSRIIRA